MPNGSKVTINIIIDVLKKSIYKQERDNGPSINDVRS